MGLLRGVARTAVIAGTATAVSNRVSRRQADKWAAQGDPRYGGQPQYEEAPPAPAPAAAPAQKDMVTQLKELAELKDQGILTDAEFEAQKAKILAAG
jgi:Short C-terminal domain